MNLGIGVYFLNMASFHRSHLWPYLGTRAPQGPPSQLVGRSSFESISWVIPPTQDASHHQDDITFFRIRNPNPNLYLPRLHPGCGILLSILYPIFLSLKSGKTDYKPSRLTWLFFWVLLIFNTLRTIGPSKLAILRTLPLLYRFIHPSIGGSLGSLG